ncbi:MAG TPA: dephospho-CoA kinase [Gemmataceae bacterium]|nr:dephospho-CoA kinase [Gemmataceae bacterium]
MTTQNSELRTQNSKLVVGLIGGIGSGKSQVAAAFARHGARIIAGDQLGQAALRDPDIRARVASRWGRDIVDEKGEIDRRRLAAIVFADPEERKALEAITHPWIRQRIRTEIKEACSDPRVPFVVLDAAVMLEAGWNVVCDRLVFIEAPRAKRLERVARQRGWSEKEVDSREQAQLPLTEKAIRADHVVDNSASLEHLNRQVNDLLHLWGLAHACSRSESEP